MIKTGLTNQHTNDTDFIKFYLDIIAGNVASLRGQLTQEEFSAKVGVSRPTISRMENRRNFYIRSLLKIAEHFNIHPQDLFLSQLDKSEETVRKIVRDEHARLHKKEDKPSS